MKLLFALLQSTIEQKKSSKVTQGCFCRMAIQFFPSFSK